jgi:hypothetical protein
MPSPLVRAVRLSALLSPMLLVAVTPSAAVAVMPEGWDEPEPMGTLTALLLFGGIPLALFLGILVLTVAPSIARGNTPSADRWATPQWFNGPPGDRALPAAPAMGGADSQALTSSSTRALPGDGTGSGSVGGRPPSGHSDQGLTASGHVGGSDTATPGPGVPAEHDVLAAASSPGGGASARW